VNLHKESILSLLTIEPSLQSQDYIESKKQFQLHNLITEQRHPKTWNLSSVIQEDIQRGLEQIFAVDEDITRRLNEMAEDPAQLEQAAQAVTRALRTHKKIYIYGCGATGRLAKQIESAIWRPFWRKVKQTELWTKLEAVVPEEVENCLTGELTGGDRALISSLEGLEDLELVGKLQLKDHGIKVGDLVFCITEGGETSSVIGTILAALDQYGELSHEKIESAAANLYFLYNNPDEVLLPFERSRKVLEQRAITKINLTTGPQTIAGSTRMQATTSETYVMGIILEEGIAGYLQSFLSKEEMTALGFDPEIRIKERLLAFENMRQTILSRLEKLAQFTSLEAATYRDRRRATYFAQDALITVFTDCAERSPTFHLYPIDTTKELQRKCWLQVSTAGNDLSTAWGNFLGRRFRGLKESFYLPHFQTEIDDAFLRESALQSLSQAGDDQEQQYDFSFSAIQHKARLPLEGELCVLVCMDEEISALMRSESVFFKFIELAKRTRSNLALILISENDPEYIQNMMEMMPLDLENDFVLHFQLASQGDPLKLNSQILLKMILNGHSTGVMANLGRVVGNTMTNVHPTNLKLIGRATYLIQSHVNDTLSREDWIHNHGKNDPITYAEANAVLFESIEFISNQTGQHSEAELSIIRILEALKKKRFITWKEAMEISIKKGLELYLCEYRKEQGGPG